MQKVWSFAIIAIIGFVMITSSLPQEVFAGKDTLRLSIWVVDSDGKVIDVDCWLSLTQTGARGEDTSIADVDNTGNSGKVTFTFDQDALDDATIVDGETIVWVYCDDAEQAWPFTIDKKNSRADYTYDFVLS